MNAKLGIRTYDSAGRTQPGERPIPSRQSRISQTHPDPRLTPRPAPHTQKIMAALAVAAPAPEGPKPAVDAGPHPLDEIAKLDGSPQLITLGGPGADATPNPAYVASFLPRAPARRHGAVLRATYADAATVWCKRYRRTAWANGVRHFYVTEWTRNTNTSPNHVQPVWGCASTFTVNLEAPKKKKKKTPAAQPNGRAGKTH